MSGSDRIVWSEGMFLGPHHFQQWDRHAHAEMAFRQAAGAPFTWGVRRLDLDQDALANGRLSVRTVEAVFPGGATVQERDPLPPARSLDGRFPPDQPKLEVFLALPEARPRVPVCGDASDPAAADSRYHGAELRVADENDADSEAEVTVARPNLKLLLTGESLDGHDLLKLAEIERKEDGTLAPARDFAPASLTLAAAGPVTGILRTVLEILVAKSTALAGQTRQHEGGMVEFGVSDVGNYWMLHTVNSFIPLLAHDLRTPDTHPEFAYLHLAQLAGALCTFGVEKHPRDVAAYEHENPGPTFRALERLVRGLLQKVDPSSRYVGVTLARENESTLLASVENEALLRDNVQWYLAVSGELDASRVQQEVPSQIVVGSPHNIEYLISTAVPGVAVEHVATPPRDFPLKAGRSYFRLGTSGEIWDTVKESRALAVYLGGTDLRELHYELIATIR